MTSKSEKELVIVPGGNGAEPVEGQELLPALDDMTPREIVAELDKYIVGQTAAKRAVAVALRNRVRRQKLPPEIERRRFAQKHSDDWPHRRSEEHTSELQSRLHLV